MKELRVFKAIHWLVVLAIPFFLLMATLRLLISWDSPSYPEFEYARIAPDRYGFSDDERLAYATASLDYLRRPEPADPLVSQSISLLPKT